MFDVENLVINNVLKIKHLDLDSSVMLGVAGTVWLFYMCL